MINVKEAAESALRHFEDLFKEDGFKKWILEEVELSEDGESWNVVIGYQEPPSGSLGLDMIERRFKMLQIRGEDGALIAVKRYHFK